MKLHTGLVLSGLLSLGVLSYACANGDTLSNSSGNSGGSNGSGGSSSGNSGGSNGNTGGSSSHTGGTNGSTGGNTGNTGGTNGAGGTHATGGNTGTGGIVATGGTTGSTGGTTATGTGGSSPLTCIQGGTNPPANALITDFSDAVANTMMAGQFTFGATVGDPGGTTTFANPASTKGTLTLSAGALTFTAAVSVAGTASADQYPFNGFGIYLNGPACANVSAYSGVSFTISGSVGTCGLVFSFNDSEHTASTDDSMRGSGAAGSYAPQLSMASMITSSPTTVMVPLSSTGFTGGSPAVSTSYPDKAKFTGIQWQFTQPMTATTPCMGTLTVDNIKFY